MVYFYFIQIQKLLLQKVLPSSKTAAKRKMLKCLKVSGGEFILNVDLSYEFCIHIQNNLLNCYIFFDLAMCHYISFAKKIALLRQSFLKIDFNRMKINSVFRIF